MSVVIASRPFKLNALAICMCLLAFAFAFEAKLAWYGPARGAGCEVRAAKACPAKNPQVVAHGISAPNSVQPEIHPAVLAESACTSLLAANLLDRVVATTHPAASFSPYLNSNLFFRPPPIR
jgi:hypothetical protein